MQFNILIFWFVYLPQSYLILLPVQNGRFFFQYIQKYTYIQNIQKHMEIKTRQAHAVNKAGCLGLFPGYDFYA